VFTSVLQSMARIGGMPDIPWATVPHPLGSLTTPELRERAELALAQFEKIVLGAKKAR
jgi:hypothetical protein